jgi:hypothetical protein
MEGTKNAAEALSADFAPHVHENRVKLQYSIFLTRLTIHACPGQSRHVPPGTPRV